MKKIFNQKNIHIYVYIILFILSFLLIAGQDYRLRPGDDDVVHTQMVKEHGSALNAMVEYYNNWNGRYATFFTKAYVMDKNIWLWRILNTFILFALFIYSAKIIKVIYNLDIKKYIITLFAIFAFLALLPITLWRQSITWVTGSFNYLWPGAALVIYLYYLLNYVFNKKSPKIWEFLLLIPVVIFVGNMELTAAIFIVISAIGMIYFFTQNKRFDIYLLILFVIGVISFIITVNAPGIPVRYEQEVKNWFPIFNHISFTDKIIHGFPYTVLFGFLCYNYPSTILLSILLFIIIKNQYYNKLYNVLALLPGVYSLIFRAVSDGVFNIKYDFFDLPNFSHVYILQKYTMQAIDANLALLTLAVIVAVFILCILAYFVFIMKWDSVDRKILALLFFGAAIASAFTLSFSPTIYASGIRIWFVPYVMYMLGIGMIFIESLRYINVTSKKFIVIFSIYCVAGLIDVFSKVYR